MPCTSSAVQQVLDAMELTCTLATAMPLRMRWSTRHANPCLRLRQRLSRGRSPRSRGANRSSPVDDGRMEKAGTVCEAVLKTASGSLPRGDILVTTLFNGLARAKFLALCRTSEGEGIRMFKRHPNRRPIR